MKTFGTIAMIILMLGGLVLIPPVFFSAAIFAADGVWIGADLFTRIASGSFAVLGCLVIFFALVSVG